MPLSVTCPGCREPLDVDEEYRTWKVRCPRCETEFVPEDRRPARVADRPPPRRARDDDADDYDDRPRRRRRFTRDDYDQALAEVYGPALCLEVLGWLGVVASLLAVSCCVFTGAAANAPGGPKNDDAVVMIVIGVVLGVLALPYSLAMTVGGRHFRRLTSRGWATTAASLGIGGFVLFGVFGLFHLAGGIWALVVSNKLHVKEAFDYLARHGRPPDDSGDYDEDD